MTTRPDTEADLRRLIRDTAMDGDIPERRGGFGRIASGQPEAMAERVERGGVPALAVGEGPELVWFHGGGYVFGAPETHLVLAAALARQGLRVLLPRYRLAPEAPWPAMLEDARAFVAASGPVVLGGDSAGGHLALAVARRTQVAGLALASPNTDRTGQSGTRGRDGDLMNDDATDAELARMAMPGMAPDDPDVSPLVADLSGLPPLHLEAAGAEILLDDSLLLARAAALAGVDVRLRVTPGQFHMFQLWPDVLPRGDESLARLGAFARDALARETR